MTTLKNLTIYLENEIIYPGYITFDEQIIDIGTGDIEGIDMDGKWLIPGYIDQHIHGANGADVMDGQIQALQNIASILPQEGVTSFLATTMTETKESILNALKTINQFSQENKRPGAQLIGVHLEGPFISKVFKGAQREDAIIKPSLSLFDTFQEASNHLIKQVTLAPEVEGSIKLIDYLTKHKVISSIGHSDATGSQAILATQHGANCFTHAYSAMRRLHHRDLGVVGAMLLTENTYAELICDYIHSSIDAIKLLYKNKTSDLIILITDAMRAKLLKDGNYYLGGQKVIKSGHEARLEDGTLAGSVLRFEDGVKNMRDAVDCTVFDLIKMASINPAKLHGIFHQKGSIAVGKDADLLIVNEQLDVLETYCKGIRCY